MKSGKALLALPLVAAALSLSALASHQLRVGPSDLAIVSERSHAAAIDASGDRPFSPRFAYVGNAPTQPRFAYVGNTPQPGDASLLAQPSAN